MNTITHKTGQEVVVSYFGDLREKLMVATGYINAVNHINRIQTEQDKILRPTLTDENAHKSIVKAHNKFYGLDNKYDGKGNLRATS